MKNTLVDILRRFVGKGKGKAPVQETSDENCCSGTVHIAYRGVSDERLYLSKGRTWSEVRYFRPHGLRVFCADCRRRML
ncbi:MAG TPA: hypothetical protein PKN86_05110 [Candidatus Obscuribacter sp.]|nr:hypothetical protein [Candidatus Obscuribacter sp.]MBK9281198.1 hypothetical protein [Candidatus Obscuribacter sp.]HMY02575.1 hypothetical protein [Candidatus Obscuribacter sp.]HNB14770.1 hypothetical protein [Candidatus Obscuribacter sp.]HND69032.1 hypothetical protein [Candidatus Obscuribacter sp.]